MAACEKCWRDSGGEGEGYGDLVRSRNKSNNTCTPEEQAGPYATECPACKRMTLHQHTHDCMAGCSCSQGGLHVGETSDVV